VQTHNLQVASLFLPHVLIKVFPGYNEPRL
jgi:hypothetical protein